MKQARSILYSLLGIGLIILLVLIMSHRDKNIEEIGKEKIGHTEYFTVKKSILPWVKRYPQSQRLGISEREIHKVIRLTLAEKTIDIVETKDHKFLSTEGELKVHKFEDPDLQLSFKPHLNFVLHYGFLAEEDTGFRVGATMPAFIFCQKYYFPSIGLVLSGRKFLPLIGVEYKIAGLYEKPEDEKNLCNLYCGAFLSPKAKGFAFSIGISK